MAIKTIPYHHHKLRISYEILNPDQERTLLFLHGWGSNKEIMKQAFGSFLKGYRHLYLDLPGFGKSDNPTILTTSDYALIVDAFLQELQTTPYAVIGHSFGGKVATLLAPERLVLLSSAGIVWPKSLKIRAKIAIFKMLKPLGMKKFRDLFVSEDAKDMPSNMYETFKNVVDEDFSDRFASFNANALLCWGEEDRATPLKSGRKIAALIPHATLRTFRGDHYFFLHDPQPVIEAMEDFLERV